MTVDYQLPSRPADAHRQQPLTRVGSEWAPRDRQGRRIHEIEHDRIAFRTLKAVNRAQTHSIPHFSFPEERRHQADLWPIRRKQHDRKLRCCKLEGISNGMDR
jgi:hypothetical protein